MKKNLSIREAAKACGVPRSTLHRFENGMGLMEMSTDKLERIASFYKWDLKDIIRAMKAETGGKRAKVKSKR